MKLVVKSGGPAPIQNRNGLNLMPISSATLNKADVMAAVWMVGISPIGYAGIGYHPFVVGVYKVGMSCI